jgi:5-methylcytosine-specific restriction endonuclease McrA
MKAAKVVRRYPDVLEMLASGRVTLTTIRLLAPHLTPANHRELFEAAAGLGKRQVQELLALRFPEPDVPSWVHKLPPSIGPFHVPPPLVRPLSPDRYQITFTASGDTRDKLSLAQDLLRHAVPSGDPAQIFARALDLLVEELVRQKYAMTDRPRRSRGQAEDSNSRSPTNEVRRAVYIRDLGRCAYVGPDGRRCGERAFVEFHHVVPVAAGGRATIENTQLRCRAHNDYEAEQFFGPIRSALEREDLARDGVRHDTNSFQNESAPPTVETPDG